MNNSNVVEKKNFSRIQPYTWHDFSRSSLPSRHCDDVVDDTDFKKSLQQERDFALTEGNTAVQGIFDFPDGKIDSSRFPTKLEIALRSGELDKADVDTVQRALDKTAKEEVSQSADKASKDKASKVQAARQAALDSTIGFDSSSVK